MLKFELTVEEANVVLAALGKMPYEQVVSVIVKIRDQAQAQLAPPTTE